MIGIMVPRLLDQIGETESAEKSQSIRSAVINNLSLADSIESKQPGEGELNALEAVPKPYSLLFHLPRNRRVRELGGKALLFPHAGNASHDPPSNRAREADPETANILSDIADESHPPIFPLIYRVGSVLNSRKSIRQRWTTP